MFISFKKTKLLFAILAGAVTLISVSEVVAATNQKKIDACVDEWVKARRKEIGPNAPIPMDQLDEWEGWCKAGKYPKASKAEPQAVAVNQKKIDACVQKWVKAHRKEIGPNAPIPMDQLDEWEGWCKAGKYPKN